MLASGDGAPDEPVRPVNALHDSVIQRLFATALQLQSVLGQIPDPTARHRVRQSVDVLDEIIGEVRSTLGGR
jgi:two-component system, NarL family, sensor histidine kinase DevS